MSWVHFSVYTSYGVRDGAAAVVRVILIHRWGTAAGILGVFRLGEKKCHTIQLVLLYALNARTCKG